MADSLTYTVRVRHDGKYVRYGKFLYGSHAATFAAWLSVHGYAGKRVSIHDGAKIKQTYLNGVRL